MFAHRLCRESFPRGTLTNLPFCFILLTSASQKAYIPTVFENYVTLVNFDSKLIEIALWDTAGQEEYDRLRPLSYPESNVILIVFSVDFPTSLENVLDKVIPILFTHTKLINPKQSGTRKLDTSARTHPSSSSVQKQT